jgi:RHS repeat-associated protein
MVTSTSAGLTTSYLINYAGQRVKKANSTETVYYVYDDAGHMIGEYDAAGTLIQELIWLGDTPVALRGKMPCLTGGTCTETANAYIWTDHLNTPREITRVNASNVHVSLWKWDSLPFGETLPNANPTNLGVMTFNHRFPGQYRDKETGLYQNWNRDYEPKLGRYVESDPKGQDGGINLYLYSMNRPIDLQDRFGLDPYPQCGQTPDDAMCRGGFPKPNSSCKTTGWECMDKCVSTLNPWWTTPVAGAVGVGGEAVRSTAVRACARVVGGLAAAWGVGTAAGCALACGADACSYD